MVVTASQALEKVMQKANALEMTPEDRRQLEAWARSKTIPNPPAARGGNWDPAHRRPASGGLQHGPSCSGIPGKVPGTEL
jgi:hypothetical protein